MADRLAREADLSLGARTARRLDLTVNAPTRAFTEEERSKMPTVFTVLRAVVDLFYSDADSSIGLSVHSATISPSSSMRSNSRFSARKTSATWCCSCRMRSWWWTLFRQGLDRSLRFSKGGKTTANKSGDIAPDPFRTTDTIPPKSDHRPANMRSW